jgi:beta-N-acetylhexosaminidase
MVRFRTGNPVSRRGVLLSGAALAAAGVASGAAGVARAATVPTSTAPARKPALSTQQLAGQRVIYSYSGLTPPASLLQQISAGQAAGVIFFGGNISSESQIASVIKQLNQANASSPVKQPLLLMTDQEGGEVRRLPGEPTLSEKQIGESSDPATAAAQAGTGAGQNLAGVGMNVNLAPVLDVFRQAGDFDDQYQRSYSSDPRVVRDCGRAFIKAQQATGVAATAKHFPGLGAATASQNTDVGPVTLNVSLSDLRAIDELPYPDVVAYGTRMVMCSWAVYPALDASRPAGLSSKIVQGELRNRLGFTGVTVTDALEAGAISSFGSYGSLGVQAAQAGMDLLLASAQDPAEGQEVVSAVAAALENGTLGQPAFTAAVNRISALRSSL